MSKKSIKLIVLIGVIFVSFSSILSKIASAPPLIIATYRLGFSTLIMLPIFIRQEKDLSSNMTPKLWILCAISGILLALHFTTWLTSVKMTSIASSTVLVNTHPIFILLGMVLVTKEKVSKKAVLSVLIALVGSIVITLGDSNLGNHNLTGDLLAIAGGFFVAAYMLIGRYVRQHISVTAYTFIVYASCTLVLLVFDILTKTSLVGYPQTDYMIFIGLAVFCTLFGHSVFNWALGHLKPTFVSTSILGEPVFATIWAIFLLSEHPTLPQLLGGALILFGITMHIQAEPSE
jgi:drug/metabolite transporter (DMT)-like permease